MYGSLILLFEDHNKNEIVLGNNINYCKYLGLLYINQEKTDNSRETGIVNLIQIRNSNFLGFNNRMNDEFNKHIDKVEEFVKGKKINVKILWKRETPRMFQKRNWRRDLEKWMIFEKLVKK